jgi:hypothetical protein
MPAAAANIPPDAQQAVLDAQAAMKAATDSPEMQAAKANADLLRPNKELLEKTLGEAWLGM